MIKKKEQSRYGEFKCPHCDHIAFDKVRLAQHIGGKHRAGQMGKNPKCKDCNSLLVKDKNWAEWAYTTNDYICIRCKNIRNKSGYHRRKVNKLKGGKK